MVASDLTEILATDDFPEYGIDLLEGIPRFNEETAVRTGLHAEFERDITAADIAAFADLSRDWNPLHTDREYAAASNYGRRIVHGAFQVGLASAMAGMYLPGRAVVVGSFQCRFPAPLYYPSRVKVQGEITAWTPHSAAGTLRVRVVEVSRGALTSEIHVGFTLHETRSGARSEAIPEYKPVEGKPVVLVTGASGGLGQKIAEALCGSYQAIGLMRSAPPQQNNGGMEWISADLAAGDWESAAERQLQGRKLYGLIHAAWPPVPQGGLLDVEMDAVKAQLEFGGACTIRIARFLRSHAAAGGARMVVLGTTAATGKPVLNMAAYSLGKAALEHTVRLLAPELARSNITINTIAPSFTRVGMNREKTNRVVLTETAKVPLGKLCSAEDVAQTVGFFLSPGAAFISGQMLPLTGGQL